MYLYTRTQIIEYDVKSKYPEEYSTVDKVGRKKTFSKEILFRVELISSTSRFFKSVLVYFISFFCQVQFCIPVIVPS